MPLSSATENDVRYMRLALAEAEKSYAVGGVPVGSVMILNDRVIAAGRNRTQELNDPTSHAETDCIRNCGFRGDFGEITLYSTLSPCMMCTGAMLFLGIPRIVIGDRENYPGDVGFLLERGLEVILLDDPDCIALMRRFATERADLWRKITAGDQASAGSR